jgi:hypothetical protein
LSLKSTALKALNTTHKVAALLPACGSFRPLRGNFSAYQELKEGKLQGHLITESQPIGTCPPGSMTERAAFRQHDHQPWPVFWTKTKDARLIGKMLLWRDLTDRICSEAVYQIEGRRRLGEDKPFAQLIVPRPEKIAGAWTSITSPWNDGRNYYHWLLDGLARLSIRDKLPEQAGILLPTSLPRFALETLSLLGLEDQVRFTDSPAVSPETYYFCAPAAMTGVLNPDGYQWLRKSFSPHFSPLRSGPPIFLTRRGHARVPDDLDGIEAIFRRNGFEVVDCGAIPVKRQIELFSGASAIAGLHGAAMTNLLWVPALTPVIEIFETGYLNGCYEQIAFQGNLNYTHVINTGSATLRLLDEWCRSAIPSVPR